MTGQRQPSCPQSRPVLASAGATPGHGSRRAAERSKSTARALLSDPVMVATGIQIIGAIGLKRLVPILAVGGLAFGLLAGRSPMSDPTGDEAPPE